MRHRGPDNPVEPRDRFRFFPSDLGLSRADGQSRIQFWRRDLPFGETGEGCSPSTRAAEKNGPAAQPKSRLPKSRLPKSQGNAFGANKPVAAAPPVLRGSIQRVSLDEVVETLPQTGAIMQDKETSPGGAAVNVAAG